MNSRRAVHRLLALGRAGKLDAELDAEIAAHLELAERDLVAAGLSPEDARRTARQRFGGVEPIKEAHRDSRSARWLEAWWHDLRAGVRGLRRAPGFCAAAVLILGLSIGANTTMFSAVRAILLQPLGYADPDALVVVLHEGRFPVAPANFLDWRAQTRSFERHGRGRDVVAEPRLATGAERVPACASDARRRCGCSASRRALGRLLGDGRHRGGRRADRRDRPRPVAAPLRRRSTIVGRTMRLDGELYTIVGVMPPRFVFAPFWATNAELWAPLPLDARRDSRDGKSLRIFARLKPGVSPAAAQADVDVVTARLERRIPGTNRSVQVVPLKERVVGHTRLGLTVLLVAVGFVLLIACANVAHMLLARAATRQSEIAVRLALGATRFQIVRQLLVESLLLSGLSSVVGLALAAFGVRAVAAMAPPDLPRAADMAVEGWTLAFTLGVSIVTGLVFGLVPAWQAARTRIGDRLGARGTTGHGREALLRDVFVVSELALALVLLVGAGLDAAQPRGGVGDRSGLRPARRAVDVGVGARFRRGRSEPARRVLRHGRRAAARAARRRGGQRRQPCAAGRRRLDARLRRRRPAARPGRTIAPAASTASCCPATSRRCGCRWCAAATSAPPTIGRRPASSSSARRSPAATSRTATRSAVG